MLSAVGSYVTQNNGFALPPTTDNRLTTKMFGYLLAAIILAAIGLNAQTLTPVAPLPTTVGVTDSAKADSVAVKPKVTRADTSRVVMHSFNHRQQLITGGAIMATMISIMVVMNNYNPRVPQ
jgi:hypothetical protein